MIKAPMRTLLLLGVLCTIAALGSSPVNRITICQGEIGSISCNPGQSLRIYSAYYGRFVSGEEACPHRTVTPNTDLSCIADVSAKVQRQCDGHHRCSVKAANRNFEDRCRSVFKHLDIEFYCTNDPITTEPPMAFTTQSLSEQVADCLDMKRTTTDTCEALMTYKACLLSIEMREVGRAPEIERVMPALDESIRSCLSPVIMLCKHKNLKGRCTNVTEATADLGELDNMVQSVRVFSGNWALFSEPHFRGQRYDVRNGFTSLWMGVYSPEYGSADLRSLGRSLSSLKPLEMFGPSTTKDPSLTFTSDATDMTTDFTEGSISYGTVGPTKGSDSPVTLDPGYSQWVKLDDIPASAHPTMCRQTYCILGIRVIFPRLNAVALPTDQILRDTIISRLMDSYGIESEQIVHVSIDEASSELELQIIDKKGSRQVIDVAADIQTDVQHENFIFVLGGMIVSPDPRRYGVTLKTVPELYLPIVQTKGPDTEEASEETQEPYRPETTAPLETTTANNEIETHYPDVIKQDSLMDEVHNVVVKTEEEVPKKYFYPILGAALGFFTVVVCLSMAMLYRWYKSHDYTAIKRAGSSVLNIDVPAPTPTKKMEGFENPSYLLDEVDNM